MEYWKKAAIIGALSPDIMVGITATGLIAREWGLGPTLVGLMMTASRAIALPLRSVSGPLIDYFGRKKMFCIGIFLTAISYIGLFLAPNVWVWTAWLCLLYWAFLLYLAAGIFVVEELPEKRRGYYYGLSKVLTGVGVLFSVSSMALFEAAGIGWRASLLYCAFFGFFIVAIGAVFLRESSVWLERKKLVMDGEIPRDERVPLRKSLGSSIVRYRFIIALWVFFCIIFIRTSEWFFSTFQTLALDFDPFWVSITMTVGLSTPILANPFWGIIADKIGRAKTLAILIILQVIFGLAWINTPRIIGVGTSTPVLVYFIPISAIWWAWYIVYSDLILLWRSELFPTGVRATLLSWSELLPIPIEIMGPSIVGFFVDILGFDITLSIFAILSLLTLPPLLHSREKIETAGIKIEATK